MLNALMKELAAEWEMDKPLPQDMPGVYTIPLDEGLNFTIAAYGQGGVVMNCSLAPAPKNHEEALFTQAMLANLFGQGTKGATLGLNESGTVLTLTRVIDYDVNFKEFRDSVEDFINTIDFWRAEALKLGNTA